VPPAVIIRTVGLAKALDRTLHGCWQYQPNQNASEPIPPESLALGRYRLVVLSHVSRNDPSHYRRTGAQPVCWTCLALAGAEV